MPTRVATVTKLVQWDMEDDDLFSSMSDERILKNNIVNKKYVLVAKRMGIWEEGKVVDHINKDSNDHRRANLRMVTSSENARNSNMRSSNTSGYRGISWYEQLGLWRSRIHTNIGGVRKIYLFGNYADKLDAVVTYDIGAKMLFGDFAQPNLTDIFVTEPIDIKYKRKTWRENRKRLSLIKSKRGLKKKADMS